MTRIVLLKQNSYEVFKGNLVSVDISPYSSSDYISIACPDMSEDIDLSNSFFEVTVQENGEFVASRMVSVRFEDTETELDLPGDSELRFSMSHFRNGFYDLAVEQAPLSYDDSKYQFRTWSQLSEEEKDIEIELELNSILSKITGIRFRINLEAEASAVVFKMMSIKAVSSDWTYAPIDINTISEVLEFPVSPNGDPDHLFDFPVEWESEWPVVWQELYPKDFSVSAEIFTGSLENDNSLAIFFRGGNVNRGIVNDLEDWQGTSAPASMAQLNGLALETDIAEEGSNTFETFKAEISWGSSGFAISVSDELQQLFYFDGFVFEANNRYMATFISENESFRIKIYSIDEELSKLEQLVFDTGLMNSYLLDARPGLFGWLAQIKDGDSFVDNIKHRYANFGDLVTRQFQSVTPVAGVQLAHNSTPPVQLITEFASGPWGGIVSEDLEPNTYQIVSQGKMEGIRTNNFAISDWKNTFIEFEIYRYSGKYICYLEGINGNIIELDFDSPISDEWQKFRYDLDGKSDPTGTYRLVILKVSSTTDTLWKVRNFKAETKAISWSARNQDDPWDMAPEEWIPFGETPNKTNSGIMFKEPGYVQVKATLNNNEARIHEFHVVPKYAELGRLVFGDETTEEIGHKASIAAEVNGLNVNFAAQIDYSEADSRKPVGYIWIFDSTNDWYVGPYARKSFSSVGTHHAFLQVTYSDGSVQSDFWQAFLTPLAP